MFGQDFGTDTRNQKVVGEGLAKPAGSKQFHVSGKTGTAQISQGAAGYKAGVTNYLVSFCGYFPSEAPKYSMIVSIQKPGPTASGGLMAGSVFSKIAERVYAKDLRLPLTSAIDTNTVVIPHVKAGEMRQTQRVLEELNINIQGKIADSGKEVWGSTHAAPQAFGKSGNHAEFCAERNRYGSERCSLSVGKQRIESQSGRSGESEKPVDSQRNDYKEGTDNYPYHELKVKISII